MVCPLTCGCTSTSANPWYKARVAGYGSRWLEIQIESTVNSLEQGIFDLSFASKFYSTFFFPEEGFSLECTGFLCARSQRKDVPQNAARSKKLDCLS